MRCQVKEAVEVLGGTPGVMDALLRGKCARWLGCRPSPGAFSPVDVLGHLIWGEITDWIPRARMILESHDTRVFEPFDRFGFKAAIAGKSVEELLSQFAELRQKNLQVLRGFGLGERELDLRGAHPELGQVTMRNLLATWVVHDLGHTAQVVRAMANEYAEEVGPWREYLSILT
jgi:hypothetical protein